MDALFETCIGTDCDAKLYDTVVHCPYCGCAQSKIVKSAVGAGDARVGSLQPSRTSALQIGPAAEPRVLPAPVPVPVPRQELPKPAQPLESPAALLAALSAAAGQPRRPRLKTVHKGILGAIALLGSAVWIFLAHRSIPQGVCDVSLARAERLLGAGDAAGGRIHAAAAANLCLGQAQSRAIAMTKEIDAALVKQGACDKSFRRAAGQIAEHRLETAQITLDKLDAVCAVTQQGLSLRKQINAGRTSAGVAAINVRLHLAQGNVSAARAALVQVRIGNREHPDLAALQREIDAGTKAPEAAGTGLAGWSLRPDQAAARAEVPNATPREPMRTTTPAKPGAANSQVELVHSFLRDAETAMNQLKFDAARTYVDSARRIDPGNSLVASLSRRIKERELRYMNEETSIK